MTQVFCFVCNLVLTSKGRKKVNGLANYLENIKKNQAPTCFYVVFLLTPDYPLRFFNFFSKNHFFFQKLMQSLNCFHVFCDLIGFCFTYEICCTVPGPSNHPENCMTVFFYSILNSFFRYYIYSFSPVFFLPHFSKMSFSFFPSSQKKLFFF